MRLLFIFLCMVFVLWMPQANANILPFSKEQVQLSFAPVVKETVPSVVNIYTQRVVKDRYFAPFFKDPFFNQFFGQQFGGRFGRPKTRQRMENSLGSGVLVQGDGLIVTSSHVIKGGTEIKVSLSDGREFDAEILLDEPKTDLAVLKIDTDEELSYLKLRNSDELEVGDLVLAIGNPFGVGQTVTSGIVSATARTTVGISEFDFFIQTDAAINPGNSGGALVSLDGKLVGVNTAIYSKDGGSMGIGFAIPANMVQTVIDAALNGGKMRRPWLGAMTQDLTSELVESLELPSRKGALVNFVYDDSPADDAGIKIGDVITGLGNHEIIDSATLKFRNATLPVGRTEMITYLRKGKKKISNFVPAFAPEKPARDERVLDGNGPFVGAKVSNINPALAEELSIVVEKGDKVIVTEIPKRGQAAMVGLRPGDIILEVNGQDIDNTEELQKIFYRKAMNGWDVVLKRNNKHIQLSIR